MSELTINLVFPWGIRMEDIEWSNEVAKINHALLFNIKKVKYLQVE